MSHPENINSNPYWDHRFVTDWQANGGGAQSRFFAQVAIEAMPEWLVHRVRWNQLSVCDWGCAQGEGTEMLAQILSWDVTGIDFSGAAIEQARKRYPRIKFSHENLLDAPQRPAFDVIFSSNTLEHFARPWQVFNTLADYATQFIVLLLPYREFDRHAEHEVTFDAVNIPVSPLADWSLVHGAVLDTRARESSYWPGEQILLVYARTTELAAQRFSLAQACLNDAKLVGELTALRQQAVVARTHESLELEAARSACRQAQAHVASIQAQLTSAEARHAIELEAAHEAYEQAQAHAVSIQGQLTSAEARHAIELEDAQAASEQAQAHAVSIQAQLTSAEARHAAELEAAHEQALAQAASAQAQCDAEKSRADAAEAQVMTTQARVSELEAQATRLSAELAEAGGTLRSLEDQHAALVATARQNSERIHFLQYREHALMTEVRTLLATKSWRMTAPLRAVRGTPVWIKRRLDDVKYTYVHGGVRSVVHRSLTYVPKHLKRRSITPITPIAPIAPIAPITPTARSEAVVPAVTPTPELQRELADVLVFGIIDWRFRIQRPQHLAREFARAGHRVYYFSNHFEDATEPGFSVEQLDDTLPLYQVTLKVSGAPAIYFAAPTEAAIAQILAGMQRFRAWSDTHRSYCLVQHGYWYPVATRMQSECLTYDCMDHHEGFGNVPPALLALEEQMMRRADLLVATSTWLETHARQYNPHVEVIRNAGQYADFCDAPAERYVDPHGRPIIGYYGAIAEWFDVDLVARVAQAFPDALVLLVGADTAGAQARLSAFTNIEMIGEVPYARLPYYLYAFDLCMLPFKVMPLTLATNPVKVYEYLGAGRSVVSIDLPEMAQFGTLVRLAATHEGFVEQLREAMTALPESTDVIERRQAFAAGQTWAHRVQTFRQAIDALPRPTVSAIVLTYNNLALTKDCLDSLETCSDDVDLEIVVVDNASSDGSPDYLSSWAASRSNVKLILNADNRGFAAGNNQGLAAASGDYLVILNNDTVVTRGWARRMVNHLRQAPEIGILGPLTNNIGNEARVDTRYTSLAAMHREAEAITRPNLGQWFELDTVAFFCAMLPRSTYERCGPISEDYGLGFFEDDDYCRHVQAAGWVVGCAKDVFVHHHLSASFNKLGAERKRVLFETNRAIYESKWGAWTPHRYRDAGPGR
ncbi:glycosyltransferase [Burkholderia pyrrocinia]